MSSTSEDDTPVINSDTSKGSSVSSGMQEEYNDLLKYAVVVPKWTPDPTSQQAFSMPMLRLQQPHDEPLTTVNEYSGSSSSSSASDVSSTSRSTSTTSIQSDAHDSAMGSDEIMTERKTFREAHPDHEKGTKKSDEFKTQFHASVSQQQNKDAVLDPDVARMQQQLNIWNKKLNNMVLAEFGQAKMTVLEQYRKLLQDKELAHQAQVNKMQDEIENMKELLHTYETSLARKDAVISNLTRALQTGRERQEMMRALTQWKLRMGDEKRQAFTTNLARRHRERVVAARVWQSWRSLVEGGWREKVEKACQKKAQEVCMQLTDEYENKIASLNEALAASRGDVKQLNDERERYEETMKKAFMRGVCALNLEAMTMFQNEEGAENEMRSLSAAVDTLSRNHGDYPSTGKISGVSHSCPSLPRHDSNCGKPTTVLPQSAPSFLPNRVRHQFDVTAHTRDQVPVSSLPQHQVPAKFQNQTNCRTVKATSGKLVASGPTTVLKQPKAPPLNGAPANVIVKRHQPNLQNKTTHRLLKHMTKYPNTTVNPIGSR